MLYSFQNYQTLHCCNECPYYIRNRRQDIQKYKQKYRLPNGQMVRQTDRQRDRQTDRQAHKQTAGQTVNG